MNCRIQKLRKALNKTQVEFAENLNLSQNFIWLVEKGNRSLSDRTISDICRIFNVNETWLRTGDGEMFNEVSMQEELAAFVGDVISGSDEFKQRLVLALSHLSPEGWEVFEKFVDDLTKKDPD